MIRTEVSLHPRTFAIAVAGATVFALATVAVVLGGALGDQRGHRAPVRGGPRRRGHRHRGCGDDRGHRPRPLGRRGRPAHLGRPDPVPRAGDASGGGDRPLPGPAVSLAPRPLDRRADRPRRRGCGGVHRRVGPHPVLRRDRRARGHLCGLDAGDRPGPRAAGARAVPGARRPERGVPTQGRGSGQRGPAAAGAAVGPGAREPRGRHGHQGIRSRGARGPAAARARQLAPGIQGAPGAPQGDVRPLPRCGAVVRQRAADPGRSGPDQRRGRDPGRHHELRLPVHAARVAAAHHRVRPRRPASLGGRLGPHAEDPARRDPSVDAGSRRRSAERRQPGRGGA